MVRGNGIKRSETIEKGCPCLRYGEIYTSYNVILDEPKSFVAKELFDRSVKIKKGDLVFTLTGENTEEIAKALAYLGDDEIAAGGDLAVWTGHGCDSKYLAYLMYSPQLISQKAATGNGNIVVHTSIKKLQQIEIPLPPLSVQREIVARLERELATVEKIKKDFEALAETARAEFKSELKEVFEEISRGGAETRRLGAVCEFENGDRGSNYPAKSKLLPNGEIPFISAINIANRSIREDNLLYLSQLQYEKLRAGKLQKGDIALCIRGSLGKFCIYSYERGAIASSLVILRCKELLSVGFLANFLESDLFFKQVAENGTGTAQPNLAAKNVMSFEIPLPSLAVQREVVARLDSAKARAEKLEAKAREGVAVCETMRKAILKEAF